MCSFMIVSLKILRQALERAVTTKEKVAALAHQASCRAILGVMQHVLLSGCRHADAPLVCPRSPSLRSKGGARRAAAAAAG